MLEQIKTHQQKIALVIGFLAVTAIGFYGGKNLNVQQPGKQSPAVSGTSNYTESKPAAQTAETPAKTPEISGESVTTRITNSLDCTGKIKGSSSHKYHLPGGSFYNRTTHPIACFETESQAQAAGFVKSAR